MRKVTWRLPVVSPVSIGDGINAAVAITSAEPRKGTVEFALLRAPFDAPIYQMEEDIEALLLSSTADPGVVGIAGARLLPAS
jgi:hypothetical protein